jgi:hypothetical protein
MTKLKIYINNIPYTKKGLWFYCPEKVNEPITIAKALLELIGKMEVSIYSNNFEFIRDLKNLLYSHMSLKCEYYINNDKTTFEKVEQYFTAMEKLRKKLVKTAKMLFGDVKGNENAN